MSTRHSSLGEVRCTDMPTVVVTLEVSHREMSASNLSVVGGSSSSFEKRSRMFTTPLTSHAPISPLNRESGLQLVPVHAHLPLGSSAKHAPTATRSARSMS